MISFIIGFVIGNLVGITMMAVVIAGKDNNEKN